MMANTYTLISSSILNTAVASVTFSSIPETYTDLLVRATVRTNESSFYPLIIKPNGSASGSVTQLFAFKGSAGIAESWRPSGIGIVAGNTPGTTAGGSTANAFGSVEIYIPNYQVIQNKPISIIGAAESYIPYASAGDSHSGLLDIAAGLAGSSVISSLQLAPGSSSFVAGSSFYLYGIKNS